MTVMMRISEETRDRVIQVGQEMNGASADAVIRKLFDEHDMLHNILAVRRFAAEQPEEYEAYLADADAVDRASGLPVHPWEEEDGQTQPVPGANGKAA